MPGALLHQGAFGACPHGGQMSVLSQNANVLVNAMPVASIADLAPIAGCSFLLANAPHPCTRVQWVVPATRVLVNRQPALLQTSSGVCLAADQTPQGAPIVTAVQPRVLGT
jgi:hypothetical protein